MEIEICTLSNDLSRVVIVEVDSTASPLLHSGFLIERTGTVL